MLIDQATAIKLRPAGIAVMWACRAVLWGMIAIFVGGDLIIRAANYNAQHGCQQIQLPEEK